MADVLGRVIEIVIELHIILSSFFALSLLTPSSLLQPPGPIFFWALKTQCQSLLLFLEMLISVHLFVEYIRYFTHRSPLSLTLAKNTLRANC